MDGFQRLSNKYESLVDLLSIKWTLACVSEVGEMNEQALLFHESIVYFIIFYASTPRTSFTKMAFIRSVRTLCRLLPIGNKIARAKIERSLEGTNIFSNLPEAEREAVAKRRDFVERSQ